MAKLRKRAAELEHEMNVELDRVRRAMRTEIVPYGAYENPDIGRESSPKRVQIPIDRGSGRPRER
jgi:hypothetical protein